MPEWNAANLSTSTHHFGICRRRKLGQSQKIQLWCLGKTVIDSFLCTEREIGLGFVSAPRNELTWT